MSFSKALIVTMLLSIVATEAWAKQTDSNELVVPGFGFRVSRPGDDWALNKSSSDPTSLTAKVSLTKAGGAVEVTVIAQPSKLDEGEAKRQRDETFDKTGDDENFSTQSKKDFVIDGEAAPGLQIDWTVGGNTYRVQQCYVCKQGFIYTIAIHSPVDEFETLFEMLNDIRETIQFVEISKEAKLEAKLDRLAAKCGSEVDWADSWEEASRRASQENKSILVQIRSQPGFDIADGFSTIALMDEDVVDLLNQHCVVLRFNKGDSAPFTSYEKYGIGPSSFGNTVLLARQDGTIFGDTFSYEPNTFYDFLITHLVGDGKAIEPPETLVAPLVIATWYSKRGELENALEQLLGSNEPGSHQLRGSIYVRQRKADLAIAELKLASSKSTDPSLKTELRFDEARIGLATGKLPVGDALVAIEKVLEQVDDHPRKAEFQYWLGLCQFANSDKETAQESWTQLIDTYGEDNRWVWLAAASLKSIAFQLEVEPEFGLPAEEVIKSFRSIPFEKRTATIAELQKEAIEYLLSVQRQDGSWISPPDALKAKGYNTSPFTVAITSICARSLMAHRADTDIEERIERAIEFLIQSHAAEKQDPVKTYYMDYSPWADAYLLRFLARYSLDYPSKAKRIHPLVADSVKRLSQRQKPGGGWSYYITHNLQQANRPSNQSISFMTAAVVIALLETREAGFEVPNDLLEPAVDCLDRMRNSNATFTYFLWHENESGQRNSGEEGSSGRGPLCALALAKADRGIPDEVAKCLDLFMNFKDLYSRERGKSLMHAAPGGQGSHYLMFDYVWAAEAVATLPETQRKAYRDQLLELLNSSRSQKGSYLDNPINGWHYGTAMALEALNLLR